MTEAERERMLGWAGGLLEGVKVAVAAAHIEGKAGPWTEEVREEVMRRAAAMMEQVRRDRTEEKRI